MTQVMLMNGCSNHHTCDNFNRMVSLQGVYGMLCKVRIPYKEGVQQHVICRGIGGTCTRARSLLR